MAEQTRAQIGEHHLLQAERQRKILGLVELHGAVEVADLSERFGVTTETIRRDLSELQKRRLVQRVHGGAVSWSSFEPLVAKRQEAHDEDKQRIGARAVEELPEGGSIMIDAGSTLLRFAEAIPGGRNLHVVTNSLPTAQVIAANGVGSVSLLGGEVRSETLSIVDAEAVSSVQRLNIDVLFISADGVSELGLSTPYSYEAALKEAMISVSRRVVALIDPSKFGNDQMRVFGTWDNIDVLITGSEVDRDTVAAIEASDVTVICV